MVLSNLWLSSERETTSRDERALLEGPHRILAPIRLRVGRQTGLINLAKRLKLLGDLRAPLL